MKQSDGVSSAIITSNPRQGGLRGGETCAADIQFRGCFKTGPLRSNHARGALSTFALLIGHKHEA